MSGYESALGARRGRLIRQLVTENAVLAIAGGLIGLGLAHFLVEYLRFWIPSTGEAEAVLRTENIQVDRSVIVFGLAAALFSGILSGLIPALGGTSVRLARRMKEGNSTAPGGVGAKRGRLWLSAAQVALAVVLSTGACLLVRSFLQLHGTGPGFQSEGVIALPIDAPHRSQLLVEQGLALTREVRVPHYETYWNRLYEDLDAVSMHRRWHGRTLLEDKRSEDEPRSGAPRVVPRRIPWRVCTTLDSMSTRKRSATR